MEDEKHYFTQRKKSYVVILKFLYKANSPPEMFAVYSVALKAPITNYLLKEILIAQFCQGCSFPAIGLIHNFHPFPH